MTVVFVVCMTCVAALLAFELRRRSSLIADAAHELRGPVTALSLGLESLRRQPVARRAAEALLAELGRIEAATEDVVAAGRGRRAPATPRAVALDRLVRRSGDAWRRPAALAGGRLLVDWPAGSAHVRADPRRLSQALGNLLANAVEHGGGEVVVRGRPSPTGVRVEVIDRGPTGAGAGEDAGRGANGHGHGRGLRIAERAVREAGGTLEWRRRPDGGRTVAADLPFERAR